MRLVMIPGEFGTWNRRTNRENVSVNQDNSLCGAVLNVWHEYYIIVSYHDVEVGDLEAVEQPGCGGEQGGDRQGEGQAPHIAAAHHL